MSIQLGCMQQCWPVVRDVPPALACLCMPHPTVGSLIIIAGQGGGGGTDVAAPVELAS